MGKIFSKNYTALIFCLIFSLFIFADISSTDAALPEDELFEKAYNHYLSYQPEKAIDLFDIFLQEYPASSSRDAALFWKARSLVQISKKAEALNIFMGIIKEFPSSHFRSFAESELENIERADTPGAVTVPTVNSREIAISPDRLSDNNNSIDKQMLDNDIKQKKQLAEYQEKLQLSEKAVLKAAEDRNICLASLEGEKLKTEDLSQKTKNLSGLTIENQRLREELKLKEEQRQLEAQKQKENLKIIEDYKNLKASLNRCDLELKTSVEKDRKNEIYLAKASKEKSDLTEDLKSLAVHNEKPKDSQSSIQKKQESQEDIVNIATKISKDKIESDNNTKNLQKETSVVPEKSKQSNIPIFEKEDTKYTAAQIMDAYQTASDVERKLKKKTIFWKRGDPYEDFLMEQTLLDKARELKIKEDSARYNMLTKQYSFTEKEKEYLLKYLTIDRLITTISGNIIIQEQEIRNYYERNKHEFLVSPGEKIANVLSVEYNAENEIERSMIIIDIQISAVKGNSLSDLQKRQPDTVSLKQYSFRQLPDKIRDEAGKLKDGDISDIISTDNEYIIIQTWTSTPIHEKYEDVHYVIKEKLLEKSRSNNLALNTWFKDIRNANAKTASSLKTSIALQTEEKTEKPKKSSIDLKKKRTLKSRKTVSKKTILRK
ncbi:MAG: hypothetical protein A2X59_12025 [Nitrospirae bacterium GWC2_42_7]|nr:MAG: hypothetical protein A2X59_12025 [Nitrospirae bacterium GWC2_42_7]